MRYLLLPLVLLSLTVIAAADKPSEAKVTFEKRPDGVHYAIDITPPFKMNLKAPFKFELRKNDRDLIKTVAMTEFKKEDERESYRYISTAGEKRLHYWFIACKYKNDEVVACKTFTAKEDIP